MSSWKIKAFKNCVVDEKVAIFTVLYERIRRLRVLYELMNYTLCRQT